VIRELLTTSLRTLPAARHARFTGKIRMRHAAGSAPVAVKQRAVELVNKIKIPPVHVQTLLQ
jgi:hypothetical protein